MSIKPILFNTDMVRAILDGRKTVTRRIVKFLPGQNQNWTGSIKDGLMLYNGKNKPCCRKPPYKIGDILYVRETWNFVYDLDDNDQIIEETGRYVYCADDSMPFSHWVDPDTGEHKDKMPWRPSIHMPKEAARIWLKVTGVRVERLRDISPEQLRREGMRINFLPEELKDQFNKLGAIFDVEEKKEKFCKLWNSTIKEPDILRYGWDANPWVWVIEFEQCEKPEMDLL